MVDALLLGHWVEDLQVHGLVDVGENCSDVSTGVLVSRYNVLLRPVGPKQLVLQRIIKSTIISACWRC